jgi:hypothetical protein
MVKTYMFQPLISPMIRSGRPNFSAVDADFLPARAKPAPSTKNGPAEPDRSLSHVS